MKKIVISVISILILLSLANLVFALEIKYPAIRIGGKTYTITEETTIGDLVLFLYYFILGLGGIAAFVMIVWGGIQWFVSAGDVGAIKSAKEKIFSAILGLVILLGSYLILYTIDPQLVTIPPLELLAPGEIPTPVFPDITEGVIAKTGIKEAPNIHIISSLATLAKYKFGDKEINLEGKIREIEFRNTAERRYGAILHQKPGFEPGWCEVMLKSGPIPEERKDFKSIRIFVMPPEGKNIHEGKGINFYNQNYVDRERRPWWCCNIFIDWCCPKPPKRVVGDQEIPDLQTAWGFQPRSFEHDEKALGKYLLVLRAEADPQSICNTYHARNVDDFFNENFGRRFLIPILPNYLRSIQVLYVLPH